MKKLILVIALFLGFGGFIYGQNTNSTNNSATLPNFTPPSPEAFQMTKYGDVPIDEFNGKVNLNIPLCEYKAGKLSLPISLAYNGAGVKVKDIPTQVGINWTLNAGGVISREIRDLADETNTRINLTSTELNNLNQPDCTSEAATLRTYIDYAQNDTEADVFNFNFNGYSGSFFLDATFTPILTKNDNELKIELIGNLNIDKKILITDAMGIKYYFGGNNGTEASTIDNISNGHHDMNAGGGITSFYLYRIEHPINGTIFIEYETKSSYHYNLNSEFTKTRNSLENAFTLNNQQTCTLPSESTSENSTRNYIDNPKYIKRISSSNNMNEIVFERLDINQSLNQTNNAVRTVLKSIIVKNETIENQKIELNYLGLNDVNNVVRFFLTDVILNDLTTLNDKKEKYSFEYNDPLELPNRSSYRIDKLGYFNNKNNQNLIPCFSSDNETLCPDRTSDFTYASKGVLKKVIYPTKGYTEFEYEPQPVVEKEYTTVSGSTYSDTIGDLGLEYDDGATFVDGRYYKLHDELPKTITLENGSTHTLSPMPSSISQQVTILLTASTYTSGPMTRTAKVTMKITDLTTTNVTTNFTSSSLTFNYFFDSTHNYKIELDLDLPNVLEDASFAGSFSYKFFKGFHAPTGYGVRLKRTKNFALANANPDIKRYYYKPYHKINDLSADNLVLSEETKSSSYLIFCSLDMAYRAYVATSSTKSSEYNYMDFTFNSLVRDYSNVCVSHGGDNFENGGIEKTFGLAKQTHGFRLPPITTNEFTEMLYPYINNTIKSSNLSPINGLTIKEKVLNNINGSIFKTKEKEYLFEHPVSIRNVNFYGSKSFDYYDFSGDCLTNTTLSNYIINYYYNDVYEFKKTAEREINYIDPVPANIVAYQPDELDDQSVTYPTQDQLEAPYKKIITTQDFQYGNLKGLPTEIKTTTSDGSTVITKNTYADQAATLQGLTAPQLVAYNGLVSQNNIGSPIQVEQLKNGELLSTQRTLYKNLNTNQYLPDIIQTAKGDGDLEDRVVFSEYDVKGNPTVVLLKDGSKTKYFYNTNNQVILKVENYTTSLNMPVAPTWTNPCTFINQYPSAIMSIYNYNSITNQITSIISSNCKSMYYEYDELHRLKFIRDDDHNIVKEFDQNYKPQN